MLFGVRAENVFEKDIQQGLNIYGCDWQGML